ncbi:hypothetical protein BDP27DRAFT_1323727 [Rhodocollybia butyracea]|uniref:Uncharacterized protein n=1 Tax=Rhodocollybia butyracea TaxID=206335 RepID=A0A9P5U810_9AGAR|nr:hypothetical protein BDP27DRAFT_1323727 [Rhodocollybia butyracea]
MAILRKLYRPPVRVSISSLSFSFVFTDWLLGITSVSTKFSFQAARTSIHALVAAISIFSLIKNSRAKRVRTRPRIQAISKLGQVCSLCRYIRVLPSSYRGLDG